MQGGVAYGAEVVTVEGLYRSAQRNGILVPCGDRRGPGYEVVTSPALDAAYAKTIRQGYEGQPVVATLTGRLEAMPAAPGGAGEPPAMQRFYVESVDTLAAKNPRNTCVPYDFWALGNEPFWNVQISSNEGLAQWSMLGENTVGYEYAAPLVEQGGQVTRYVFPGQQRMKVTLTKGECIDNMAGNRFPYSVVVERAGKSYRGCAHDATSAR